MKRITRQEIVQVEDVAQAYISEEGLNEELCSWSKKQEDEDVALSVSEEVEGSYKECHVVMDDTLMDLLRLFIMDPEDWKLNALMPDKGDREDAFLMLLKKKAPGSEEEQGALVKQETQAVAREPHKYSKAIWNGLLSGVVVSFWFMLAIGIHPATLVGIPISLVLYARAKNLPVYPINE